MKAPSARHPQDSSDQVQAQISETILKTACLPPMRAWYATVFNRLPFFEFAPPEGAQAGSFGGQTRASDLKLCFFRVHDGFPFSQTLGIFEVPGLAEKVTDGSPGLHHMQFMLPTFEDLISHFERLDGAGVSPHRSANHGPMTSFYFRDPDGNVAEFSAQNFDTLEESMDLIRSEVFRRNPSGVELDPKFFVAKYRGGLSRDELIKIA